MKLGFAVSLLSLFLATLPTAKAQSVTGQISGSVTDPAGAVIPGARVQLTNDLTKQVRALSTASSGSFIFPDLMPGDYSVGITQTGFKA